MGMRIVIHDYSGHPFQVQLSRRLAGRGHDVYHLFFAGEHTPRGAVARRPADPPNFTVEAVEIAATYEKYNYVKRHLQETEYGRNVARRINTLNPQALICANTPVDALASIRRACCRPERQFIIWLQDLVSVGVEMVLRRKWRLLSVPIVWRYHRVEQANLARADKIICISDDFVTELEKFRIPAERCEVIENWAPLEELTPFAGPNNWAKEQGLEKRRLVIYAGTLGLKHNPALLVEVARALQRIDRFRDVTVIVISEGMGADWLRKQKAAGGLDNLVLFPFQPYERFAEVLAAATILVAILEDDAGVFSVPSKVLSYLCAVRPILLAAPAENLATRTVRRAKAGFAVKPTDTERFIAAAQHLLDNPSVRMRLAANGRQYAEEKFDIDSITDRFERICGWRVPTCGYDDARRLLLVTSEREGSLHG